MKHSTHRHERSGSSSHPRPGEALPRLRQARPGQPLHRLHQAQGSQPNTANRSAQQVVQPEASKARRLRSCDSDHLLGMWGRGTPRRSMASRPHPARRPRLLPGPRPSFVQHRTIERESSLTESPPPGFPTGWGRNCATRNFGDPGANSLAGCVGHLVHDSTTHCHHCEVLHAPPCLHRCRLARPRLCAIGCRKTGPGDYASRLPRLKPGSRPWRHELPCLVLLVIVGLPVSVAAMGATA